MNKYKQRDPVPNNNVSNQNEATQTSNQAIDEKCDDKKLLMIPYQGGKGEQAIKTIRKTIKRLLPSSIKVQVFFTGNKLNSCFNIKDKTKFEHRRDNKSRTFCICKHFYSQKITYLAIRKNLYSQNNQK